MGAYIRALFGVVSLSACASQDSYPINPGGGPAGSGGTGGVDAGPPTTIAAKICLIDDLRFPKTCATTGADNIEVDLGSKTTFTGADGAFTIAVPTGTDPVWIISRGDDLVISTAPYISGAPAPPVMKQSDYDALLAANNVVMQAGRGSLVVQVQSGGSPVPHATVTMMQAQGVSLYDTTAAMMWGTQETGDKGIAWLPNNDEGLRSVSAKPKAGGATTAMFKVDKDSITFATVELP